MHLMPSRIEIIGVVVRQFKRELLMKSPRFQFNQSFQAGYQVVLLNRDGTECVFSCHRYEGAARQDRDLALELIS
jgi:hypothetical protein